MSVEQIVTHIKRGLLLEGLRMSVCGTDANSMSAILGPFFGYLLHKQITGGPRKRTGHGNMEKRYRGREKGVLILNAMHKTGRLQ